MDALRLQAVAARVVAWHNRHPLARRITAAQVHSIGYVCLPYSSAAADVPAPLPEGGSLRERAAARAKLGDAPPPAPPPPATAPPDSLKPGFSEDFIAPLRPRQVARWARKRGRQLTEAPSDGPLREVIADAVPEGRRGVHLFVMTAAIEADGRRSRVLLGAGDGLDLLGQRLTSPKRAASPLLLTLCAALGLQFGLPHLPTTAALPALAAAASAPVVVAAAPEPALAPTATVLPQLQLAGPATETPSALPPDAQAAEPAMRVQPLDVEPQLGRVQLPPLDLPLKARARAQAEQARAEQAQGAASASLADSAGSAASAPAAAAPLMAAAPAVAPPPSPSAANDFGMPMQAAASPKAGPATTPAARRSGTPVFAVSTRVLRTRAEAEQIAIAMQALLPSVPGVANDAVRVDVLPQGDDWRVVGWPFPAAAQADKARALLVSRGMRVAVVDF